MPEIVLLGSNLLEKYPKKGIFDYLFLSHLKI